MTNPRDTVLRVRCPNGTATAPHTRVNVLLPVGMDDLEKLGAGFRACVQCGTSTVILYDGREDVWERWSDELAPTDAELDGMARALWGLRNGHAPGDGRWVNHPSTKNGMRLVRAAAPSRMDIPGRSRLIEYLRDQLLDTADVARMHGEIARALGWVAPA